MSDTNGNGELPQVPYVGGLPLLSKAVDWGFEIHPIGHTNDTNEKVFILRIALPTGPLDLWGPASFMRDLGEKLVALAAGLHIARDVPPT